MASRLSLGGSKMAKEEKEEKGIEVGEGEASARSGTQKAKRRRSLREPEREMPGVGGEGCKCSRGG